MSDVLCHLWINYSIIPLRSPGKKSSYSRDHLCHVNLWQVPPRIGRIGKGIGNAYTSCLACLKTQPWNIQIQLVIAGLVDFPRNFLGERFTKEIYSSDFALQYALAARGWTIMPWEEAAQMHDNKEPGRVRSLQRQRSQRIPRVVVWGNLSIFSNVGKTW